MAFISEAGLRQSREKRLSFRDLGHFRRRSESFNRGGANGLPFDGAAGRLVEPRQRQRCAQFETARTLLLRDRDSGQKRFLGSRRVGRGTLQQHLAADSMQLGVEFAISGPLARRKRFVEDGEGAIDVAGPGLGLGKRNFALVLA